METLYLKKSQLFLPLILLERPSQTALNESTFQPTYESRRFRAPPDKQLVVKKFLIKFSKWSEWQRKIVLCGATERCRKELLRVLWTVLSPYFLQKKSKSCSEDVDKKKKETMFMPRCPPGGVRKPGDSGKNELNVDISSSENDMSRITVVIQFDNDEHVSNSGDETTDSAEGEKEDGVKFEADAALKEKLKEYRREKYAREQGYIITDSSAEEEPLECLGCDDQEDAPMNYYSAALANVEFEELVFHVPGPKETDKSQADDDKLSEDEKKHRQPSADSKDITTSGKNTPQSRSEKSSAGTKPRKISASAGSTRQSKRKKPRAHSHKVALLESVKSSRHLLPPIEDSKLAKVGPYMTRTVVDGKVTVTSMKNQLWWLPGTGGKDIIKPSRSRLLEGFKYDVNELWKDFTNWTNAEKGACLLEICSVCTIRELKHFADCVRQRLKERNDFGRLDDDILTTIFEYLDAKSLRAATQVCRRWARVGSANSLWENKVLSLATELGLERFLNHEVERGTWDLIPTKAIYQYLVLLASNEETLNALLEKLKAKEELKRKKEEEAEYSSQTRGLTGEAGSVAGSAKLSSSLALLEARRERFKSRTVSLEGKKTEEVLYTGKKGDEEGSSDNKFGPGNLNDKRKNNKDMSIDQQDSEEDCFEADVRVRPTQARNELPKADVNRATGELKGYSTVSVPGVLPLRSIQKLRGHHEGVMAIHSDRKRIMTGAGDHCVRVFDARSGVLVKKLEGHKGGVRCILFDDCYIYSGSWDMTIIVWNVIKFEVVDVLYEHKDCVSCLEMTGELLISASYDATIVIWQKSNLQMLHKLQGHKGAIECLALFNGQNLYSAGVDGTIRHWNVQKGTCYRSFFAVQEKYNTLKVCGDLIAAGTASGRILFFDRNRRECVASIQAHEGPLNDLCFVGRRFITAGRDKVIKEWDLSTCACLRILKGHKAAVSCLRATKKRIISGSFDNTVRIWGFHLSSRQARSPNIATVQGVTQRKITNS